jgi:cob(I)alamin adenosyltransferase
MKIYTKTGDKGTTGLFDGQRVPKNSLRVDVYGTIDELNSVIGVVLSLKPPEPLFQDLTKLSNLLFMVGTDLATPIGGKQRYPVRRVSEEEIIWLESLIDSYTAKLPELHNFILPGGSQPAAMLHLARTVCRRSERLAVTLSEQTDIGGNIIIFINRLSDYLFTASRLANHLAGFEDVKKST